MKHIYHQENYSLYLVVCKNKPTIKLETPKEIPHIFINGSATKRSVYEKQQLSTTDLESIFLNPDKDP